ncbi:MAG: UDP-glucose 4-epimerase GalE, partial [Muribaculaceae bacterium]|nr:UDP-glucose 4-epimerase GalE [Muribaculaceae bacterium]
KPHGAAVDRMTHGKLDANSPIFNVGTGTPLAVLELVNRFIAANGVDVPYAITARRDGDIPAVWADTTTANDVLGWKAERDIDDTLRAAWAWEKHVRGIN